VQVQVVERNMRKGKGGKKESSTIPFSGPALVNYSASVP